MARFLTAPKLCLLVLIELYANAAVLPASTVSVLSFLAAHILRVGAVKTVLPTPYARADKPVGSAVLTLADFERVLSSHPVAADRTGPTLWDAFLRTLWHLDSVHAVEDFFKVHKHLVAKPRRQLYRDRVAGVEPWPPETIVLSRTSPLGAFVRRATLEYTRLPFHNVQQLWTSFVTYRQPTFAWWKRRYPKARYWSFDATLTKPDDAWGDDTLATFTDITHKVFKPPQRLDVRGLISATDVDKLLDFQIAQMQKMGNRVPEVLQKEYRGILQGEVVIPSLSNYVNYLDAWKAGNYTTAFDSLYRFFDCTMQNKDRTFYQYALLSLAILHADFGCHHEAVTVMQEAVSVARENRDLVCLNYSLSWLYNFSKAYPKIMEGREQTNMLGIERDGLVFLRMKAKEAGMGSLWSSAILNEAKATLIQGGSLSSVFENIWRSSHLTRTRGMRPHAGPQLLLRSSVWSRLGIGFLSMSYCTLFLHCSAKMATFEHVLKITCWLAYILTERGHYDEAFKKLEALDANALRSIHVNQYWSLYRGILKVKRELRADNLDAAEQYLGQLLQCRELEPELTLEIDMLRIEYLMQRHEYHNASVRIDKVEREVKAQGQDLLYRVQLLIAKAMLYSKCGRPQRGFSVAVNAANMAWKGRLLTLLWEAMGVVAHLLCALEEFEAARQILFVVIPRALEGDKGILPAQLFAFLVDAYMGLAGQAPRRSLERTEHLEEAFIFLDRALKAYEAVGDNRGQCAMLARKAVIMQYFDSPRLANDYAGDYLELKREAGLIE